MAVNSYNRQRNFTITYAIGFIAYAVLYTGRVNFSIASAYFESTGQLTKPQIGIIASVFSIIYALSKIPDGFLGDLFPSRNIIVTGLLISGFSNLMISFSNSFLWIAFFWGVNAFGQAMLWGSLLKDYKENYDAQQYRKVTLTIGLSMPLGSIIGLWIASYSIEYFSVKACFMIPAVLILITAFFVRIFFINTEKTKLDTLSSEIRLLRAVADNKKLRRMLLPIITQKR